MKIGFLFPGQGAQFVGMGKDLYEHLPAARKIFDQADTVVGYSLTRLCFEGPEEELTRTLYAQPAIYTVSIAMLKALEEKYPALKPAWTAGLSLGEFSALTAAGVFGFEDGLRLVVSRAQAMEDAAKQRPGTMASILGLAQKDCESLAAEAGCEVANLNTPEQIVLSGSVETIQKACALAEERGAKRAIPLKVGGAFHSTLMESARQDLEKAIGRVSFKAPACVFVPNAEPRAVSCPLEIQRLLAKQLTSPVRWVETMRQAQGSGFLHYLEIGPGKVLKGLAKKCQPSLQIFPCGAVKDLEELEKTLLTEKIVR
ncbi:MAG: ACP S-malonyltransferase [Candidatus Omnitrophota bacterium]